MTVLRTPDSQFETLPGYPFQPNYITLTDARLGDVRMHYVDEGPRDGPVVVMLHGEPSWSYLYRKMIVPVVAAGYRVLAPDLIGFGRSDKPAERSDYSYLSHVTWLTDWFRQMAIKDITLFCQDWGGLLGLRIVGENPDWFARVMAGNTFLPTGDGTPSEAFLRWKEFSQTVPVFPTGSIIRGGTARSITPDIEAAYDAPFPYESYKAGARQFPALVPVSVDDPARAANLAAWKVLEKFQKPFLTCFSDKDAVTAGGDKIFQSRIPGCAGQPHVTIKDGGHFLQEDAGEELAALLIGFLKQG
jgi:haloalkane dehalogenase